MSETAFPAGEQTPVLPYRRTEDGQYLLYSIGWNSRDDGGVPVRNGKSQPQWDYEKGDWVWQGHWPH